MSTFVTVGNNKKPFRRLVDQIVEVAPDLPSPVLVQSGHTPLTTDRCQVVDFLNMEDFKSEIDEAELIIMHAGAGSLIHALRAGKMPVVMPRLFAYGEHVDDHQEELANHFGRIGKAVQVGHNESLLSCAEEALRRQRTTSRDKDERLAQAVREILSGIENAKELDSASSTP